MKQPYTLIISVLVLSGITTQVPAQFFLNGDAFRMNDTCYQLTNEVNWSVGSIWNPDKINLNESFDVVLEVKLGCKDEGGADGIVFGFQPVSTSIGTGGGAIGFGGVRPALGIEIDTWQNTDLNDPAYDHIAVIRDGNLQHASNLAGPVQANATRPNIEDCQFHDLRVSWDASAKKLDVYFDCQLRLTYTGDIVNTIFGGNPLVFWGFTSATGGANNVHQVCFSYTSFLNELEDVVVCPGGQLQLDVPGGVKYEWSPATGLSNPYIRNPIVRPAETTLYSVTVTDACNRPFYDDMLVQVAGDSVFFDLGPDTIMCENNSLLLDVTTPTATYQWSNGGTGSSLAVFYPGDYSVTVTRTDTICMADDRIHVDWDYLPEVELGRDTVLCPGQTLHLDAYDEDATYLWDDGSTRDTFLVRQAGAYSVLVTNLCGTVSDRINVAYDDCRELYIPNAFSPNDDGINDLFLVLDGGDVTNIRLLRIFDRWGNMLFEDGNFLPNDPAHGWDGDYRDRPCPTGMYVYFLEADFRDGSSERRSGEVYLLR